MNEDLVSIIQEWANAITAENRRLLQVDRFPSMRDQKSSWAKSFDLVTKEEAQIISQNVEEIGHSRNFFEGRHLTKAFVAVDQVRKIA